MLAKVGRFGEPGKGHTAKVSDNHGALPRLRSAVVGRVQYLVLKVVVLEYSSWQDRSLKVAELPRLGKRRDIFNYEIRWFCSSNRLGILLPETIPVILFVLLAECREALARRSSDDDVDAFWHLLRLQPLLHAARE